MKFSKGQIFWMGIFGLYVFVFIIVAAVETWNKSELTQYNDSIKVYQKARRDSIGVVRKNIKQQFSNWFNQKMNGSEYNKPIIMGYLNKGVPGAYVLNTHSSKIQDEIYKSIHGNSNFRQLVGADLKYLDSLTFKKESYCKNQASPSYLIGELDYEEYSSCLNIVTWEPIRFTLWDTINKVNKMEIPVFPLHNNDLMAARLEIVNEDTTLIMPMNIEIINVNCDSSVDIRIYEYNDGSIDSTDFTFKKDSVGWK